MRVILLAIWIGTTVAALADDVTISLSQTPAAVQKTIQSQTGDGTLGDIRKTTSDDETVYDVSQTAKDGTDHDFSVAEDGTLLTVEAPLSATPADAQSTIQTELNGGTLDSIDKNLADSEISYDVSGTTKDGKKKDFTVAEDGTLLSLDVALGDTPAVVQQTIAAQLGNGKVESINENLDEDGTSFDVEATGPHKSFNVVANGALASERVPYARVPPHVKSTIQEHIGGGTVLRVDKSFVKQQGVFPFQVEGRKDGKPFDFSVGPRGRFLGMDQ